MKSFLSYCRIRFLTVIVSMFVFFVFTGQALASIHTVSQGDSLWKIGQRYGFDVKELKDANNLKGNIIVIGQKIYIPEKQTQEYKYTVKPGDSLFLIARQLGVSVNVLKNSNGLKNDIIYPGQKLSTSLNLRSTAVVSRGFGHESISVSEFDVLARIITAEADNQSYDTKVAVGAVVLNRVKSNLFPNTIRGVVYQVDAGGRYQFEPVLNGWINRPASETAKKAARDALSGIDPSNNALYFWESWVKNAYLNSRPVSRVMGAFTFTH